MAESESRAVDIVSEANIMNKKNNNYLIFSTAFVMGLFFSSL